MTTLAVNSSDIFQYYLDNFFKFPKEIKNDIAYCQRSLKSHIKVHQMVIDVFQQEEDADPAQKQRILDEIESEMYEINAEQHFLFLRLRRIIDEFTKMVKSSDVPMDYAAINSLISREVVPLISDSSIEILPATVLSRNTEQKLIEKYFEVQKEKVIYEIEDSDEEDNSVLLSNEMKGVPCIKNKSKCSTFSENIPSDGICPLQSPSENPNSLSQMSLLKPISQRMVGNVGIVSSGFEGFQDPSKFLQMNLVEEKNTGSNPGNMGLSAEDPSHLPDSLSKSGDSSEPRIDLPVSKNVKISRFNLRQALNKARTENLVAKAAANMLARSGPSSTPLVETSAVNHPPKKYEIRRRAARNNASSAVPGATVSKERNRIEPNSSSEDSNTERIPSPPQPHVGSMEERNLPEHYGQEMFLRLFQLFTPNVLVQMQQRRSKRKRRTVHNNERADFHYGRIEYGSYPPPEKKRKEFLLSPQVKRVLQSKRKKRGNARKNEDRLPSRSSSSSPDEKRCCNECLKSGGCFDQCNECKGYYHQLCHQEDDEKSSNYKKASVLQNTRQKFCPACRRLHSRLLNKAQELEKKLAHETGRSVSLHQESNMYKLQMCNLFNIVNTIKSDQENESSG